MSPFLLLTAVSLFNLFNEKKFINKTVNYLSNLSLLIYIIHENYLLRRYVRPEIWKYIYEKIGYDYVVLIDLAYAIILFMSAILIAYLYKISLQNLIHKISDKLHERLSHFYGRVCRLMIK